MKSAEDITTEVPSTSLQPKVTTKEVTLQSINDILLDTFSYENVDNFKAGQERQGQRASTSITVLGFTIQGNRRFAANTRYRKY